MPAAPLDALAAQEGPWTLEDGTAVRIEPLGAKHEAALVAFHHRVSERSVYLRYLQWSPAERRASEEWRVSLAPGESVADVVLAATVAAGDIVGIGRLIRTAPGSAEMALLVGDAHQGKGLGEELLRRLIEVARHLRIGRLGADVLAENTGMIAIARRAGFAMTAVPGDPTMLRAELALAY
jgi:acetyltransferase